MKIGILAGICAGAALLVAGCKGFWDIPASTTTTTPTTLSSGVFYVLDQTTGQLAAYSISSGKLETVSGSPSALSASPTSVAVAPGGSFLYVGTLNGIYLYTVGSGGALTIANNGELISPDIASAMTVSGSWLIDAFSVTTGEVEIDAIPISVTTGLSTASTSNPIESRTFTIANASLNQMVLSPDGTNLFLALGTGGTIIVPFTAANANPLASTASTIGVLNTWRFCCRWPWTPSNRLFYIGETLANSSASSGGLRVFNYSSLGTGTLTQATGSPIASGEKAPNAILPLASGEYVYVANGSGDTSSGNIAWFPITASGTTYTIASGSTIATGIVPIGLAEDSDDNFVLAVSTGGSTSSGNPDLEAYTMSSGALTSSITSTTGTDPVGAHAIVALP